MTFYLLAAKPLLIRLSCGFCAFRVLRRLRCMSQILTKCHTFCLNRFHRLGTLPNYNRKKRRTIPTKGVGLPFNRKWYALSYDNYISMDLRCQGNFPVVLGYTTFLRSVCLTNQGAFINIIRESIIARGEQPNWR